MQTLEYRELDHSYWLDGVKKRALSDVLDTAEVELCRRFSVPTFGLVPDLRFVNEALLEDRAALYSQVDTANSLMLEGKWTPEQEWASSDRALPYIIALEKYWAAQIGVKFPMRGVSVQRPLYCRELDFCTIPDWYTPISVCDLKCGRNHSRNWGLRMAGQALAHGRARVQRIVHLRPQLKTRSWDEYERVDGIGCNNVFHPLDEAVVVAAAKERFTDPVFEAWRARRMEAA